MNHLQRIFETCVFINNNLCRKLVSSLEFPTKFYERFKFTSVSYFIADFNLQNSGLDDFTFNVSY